MPRFVEEAIALARAGEAGSVAGGGRETAKTLGDAEVETARSTVVSTLFEKMCVSVLEVYESKVFDLLQPFESIDADDRDIVTGTQVAQWHPSVTAHRTLHSGGSRGEK